MGADSSDPADFHEIIDDGGRLQDQEEREYNLKVSGIVLEYSALKQQEEFLNTNIGRVTEELEKLQSDLENFNADENKSKAEADSKRIEIEHVTADIAAIEKSNEDLKNKIETLTALRDEKRDAHGNFFENWNKLAEEVSEGRVKLHELREVLRKEYGIWV